MAEKRKFAALAEIHRLQAEPDSPEPVAPVVQRGAGADTGRGQGPRPAGDRQAEQSAMEAVFAFFEKTDPACRCGEIAGRG